MSSSSERQKLMKEVPSQNRKIKRKLSLVFELISLLVLVVIHSLHNIFRTIFPPAGKSLQGQIALVTGAGRGLGKGLALGLAKEGCKVAVVDINRVNAEQTAAEIIKAGGVAKAYFTNVADVEEIKQLNVNVTRDLGLVAILVNNAGLVQADYLETYTDGDIRTMMAVNLFSHFWTVREFLPSMKERNSGHIVAICSATAFWTGPYGTAYAASKSGVRGFMDTLHLELSAKGTQIQTTTVFPYFLTVDALYEQNWDLRFPPFSVDEAAQAVISGVKRESVYVSIPGHLYLLAHIVLLFPLKAYKKALEIAYTGNLLLTEEQQKQSLLTALSKQFHETENKKLT